MKTKILIFSLLVSFIFSCRNEKINITYPEFYRGYNEVKTMIANDKLALALIRFDSLSQGIPHIPSSTLFRIASACAEKGKCELAAKYLQLSLINGQEYGKGIGSYKTIDFCTEGIAEIQNTESAIHKKNFNYHYKEMIDSMLEADQSARIEGGYDDIRMIDSLNMTTLLSLIEKYGYPSEKIIGHKSAFDAFIVLLHMDRDENNEVFKSILEKAYNSGYLWPSELAWIVDRRRSWGKEELEPYYYHMPSDIYDQFSKEEVDEIDRRRDSIGLGPK